MRPRPEGFVYFCSQFHWFWFDLRNYHFQQDQFCLHNILATLFFLAACPFIEIGNAKKVAMRQEIHKHILFTYLPIRALPQHFQQLELRGVCFLTALLHMVADVNLLEYAVILGKQRRTSSECAVGARERNNIWWRGFYNSTASGQLLCLWQIHYNLMTMETIRTLK